MFIIVCSSLLVGSCVKSIILRNRGCPFAAATCSAAEGVRTIRPRGVREHNNPKQTHNTHARTATNAGNCSAEISSTPALGFKWSGADAVYGDRGARLAGSAEKRPKRKRTRNSSVKMTREATMTSAILVNFCLLRRLACAVARTDIMVTYASAKL